MRGLVLILVMVLLSACGGPAPVPTPAASPAPASPTADIATVVGRPAQGSPVLSPLTSPSPAPTTALPTATSPVSPTPSLVPTPEPERLLVNGSGSPAVNMRSDPGTNSSVVKSVRDGAEVIVVGTDREVDGRIWRNVQDGDVSGWIVGTALRPLPTPTVTPSNTASPATPPTSASTATVDATAAPSVTVSPGASATAAPVEPTASPDEASVEVFGTGGQGANMRADPGTSGRVLQTVPDGTHLTVAGPDREIVGQRWRNVRDDGGTTGWIVADAVRSLATPSAAPPVAPPATPVPTSAPAVAATPSPAPSATTARGDTPEATGTLALTGTPTATPSAGETPSVPDAASATPAPEAEAPTPEPPMVEVYGTGNQGANLRVAPSKTGSVLRSVPDGSHLVIIGDDVDADGTTWRHVQTDDGLSGWLALEVVQPVVTPTPTLRPGAPGIGVPMAETPKPEAQLSDAELAARPCRPGQVKGDATTGTYYPPDHPDYPGLLLRVRCFDDVSRARASGFRPPDPAAPPSPSGE